MSLLHNNNNTRNKERRRGVIPSRRCAAAAATAAACAVFLALSSTTSAFSPATTTLSRTTTTTTITTKRTALHLLPPLGPEEFSALAQHPFLLDPQTLDQLVQQASSTWLADAAAAAVETADKAGGGGWWQQYLLLFKGALNLVHSTISKPLNAVGIEETWGFSIAIFTFLARSLLVPLSIQQSKSSEYMKALRPYLSEIREKFKDNQDAQNRAIGKLYEDANQNPLAGCFVSLAQLPIFLGLYRGVRLLAMDGELQESFLWIPSLQGPVSPPDYRGMDWLTQGWHAAAASADGGSLPVPSLGWETTIAFLVMPVILVVLQTITMKSLQPPMDENMSEEERKTMEQSQGFLRFLPLMIGFFSLQVPAGLTIYWFTSNIFTLTQSLAVRAYFAANPPDIELPEYWDQALLSKDGKDFESMTPEERRRANEAGIRVGPTLQDMEDEARFHTFVERTPLKPDTQAGQQLLALQSSTSSKVTIASELEDWVKAANAAATTEKQPNNTFFAEPVMNTQ